MHPYACFDLSGNVQDTPRASRSCVTTGTQDNRLRSQHLQDRFRPATRTAATSVGNHGHRISAQTVINRLKDHGIRPPHPYVGPQLAWQARHLNWVLFTDESRFTLERSDGINVFIDVLVSVLETLM